MLLENQRDFPQAADEARRALTGLGALPSIEAVKAHLILARDFRYRADVDHERDEAQRALALVHGLDAAPDLVRARVSYIAALSALDSSDFAEAQAAMQRALADLDACTRASAAESRRVATMRAVLLTYLGRDEDALRIFDAVLDDERRTLGADHPLVADALMKYSAILQHMGRLDDASTWPRIRWRRSGAGPARATPRLRRSWRISPRSPPHAAILPRRARGSSRNASCLPAAAPLRSSRRSRCRSTGRACARCAAKPARSASTERCSSARRCRARSCGSERIYLGWAYLYDGDAADALEWFRGLEAHVPRYDSPRERSGKVEIELGEGAALVQLTRNDEAAGALRAARDALATSPSDVQRATLLLWRGRAEMRGGETNEGLADIESALALRQAAFGEDSAWTAQAELAHADALALVRRGADAKQERASAEVVLAQMRDAGSALAPDTQNRP